MSYIWVMFWRVVQSDLSTANFSPHWVTIWFPIYFKSPCHHHLPFSPALNKSFQTYLVFRNLDTVFCSLVPSIKDFEGFFHIFKWWASTRMSSIMTFFVKLYFVLFVWRFPFQFRTLPSCFQLGCPRICCTSIYFGISLQQSCWHNVTDCFQACIVVSNPKPLLLICASFWTTTLMSIGWRICRCGQKLAGNWGHVSCMTVNCRCVLSWIFSRSNTRYVS